MASNCFGTFMPDRAALTHGARMSIRSPRDNRRCYTPVAPHERSLNDHIAHKMPIFRMNEIFKKIGVMALSP